MPAVTSDQAYQRSVDAQLNECDIGIRELRNRVEVMLIQAEIAHQRRIEALRSREQAIRDRLRNLSRLDDQAIHALQVDTQNELDDLKRSIRSALEEYK